MKFLHTLLLLLFLNCSIHAQIEHLESIKVDIKKVEDNITEAKQAGDMANLFVNQIRVNHLQASIPPFGKYQKEVSFWYSETPKKAIRNAHNPLDALQKVSITSQLMGKNYETHYVFKKHKLVYFNTKGGEENLEIYYYDNKPIYFVNSGKTYEKLNAFQVKRAGSPLLNAEKLQKLYTASFLD